MKSEFDFVGALRRRQKKQNRDRALIKGIGDDAAVLRHLLGRDTLATSDLMVEDIDFNRAWTSPAFLGHKALAVSLSDIAAMGGHPQWALLSLGIPLSVWRGNFITEFFRGFFALARRHKVTLIGGDVSRTPDRIVIDSTLLGTIVTNRGVFRSGAQHGDHIFVTGKLGGAATGLALLVEGKRFKRGSHSRSSLNRILLRQLRPDPRVLWGEALAKAGLATSMIDLSDGLSSDLAHLCQESRVGALIEGSSIPIDRAVKEFCRARSIDPASIILNGGEDFELLFTVAGRNVHRLPEQIGAIKATRIGTIVSSPKYIRIRDKEGVVTRLASGGFTHFE